MAGLARSFKTAFGRKSGRRSSVTKDEETNLQMLLRSPPALPALSIELTEFERPTLELIDRVSLDLLTNPQNHDRIRDQELFSPINYAGSAGQGRIARGHGDDRSQHTLHCHSVSSHLRDLGNHGSAEVNVKHRMDAQRPHHAEKEDDGAHSDGFSRIGQDPSIEEHLHQSLDHLSVENHDVHSPHTSDEPEVGLQRHMHDHAAAGCSHTHDLETSGALHSHQCQHEDQPLLHNHEMPQDVMQEQDITDYAEEGGFRVVTSAQKPDRVVLDIQGMDCSGCEAKLNRALKNIPGVLNLQTSLILSKAEFDLDEKTEFSVDDIMKLVQRSTGFVCFMRAISNTSLTLDVIVAGRIEDFMLQEQPKGLIQMTHLGGNIVRLNYDPAMIGARTMIREALNDVADLAPQQSKSEYEAGRKHLRALAQKTALSVILTLPVLVIAWAPLPQDKIAYQIASLILATIVQVVVASSLYLTIIRALLVLRQVEADLLVVLSSSTAYILSVICFIFLVAGRPLTFDGAETSYFQASTLLITLIMAGRLISAAARQRAIESLSFGDLQPTIATLCKQDGRVVEEELDVRLLQHGDHFLVRSMSQVPSDGIIVNGSAEFDEAIVTGETSPVSRQLGSAVRAGGVNVGSAVVVRLTHLPGANSVAKLRTMIDNAKASRTKTALVVDRVAQYFVPVILLLATITFLVWLAIGIAVRNESGGHAALEALTYSLAVLVVACPCGLCLIVPLVVAVIASVAARQGIIVKEASTFGKARHVSHVVFDKTGTLTDGVLTIEEELYLTGDRELAKSLLLALTQDSAHPVSRTISRHLFNKGARPATLRNQKSWPGKGVEATYYGAPVRCGNIDWLSVAHRQDAIRLQARKLTTFSMTLSGVPLCFFGLSSKIRPEAASLINSLRERHVEVSILSGDVSAAVETVAEALNISLANVRSRCSPGDKHDYIINLIANGAKVLFIGDGTNDAPAIAAATVGVHIPDGTANDEILNLETISRAPKPRQEEIVKSAANVVLLRPDLSAVKALLDLSDIAWRRIVLALIWSGFYNLIAIAFTAGIFVHVRVTPQWAALGEVVSVLPVIALALSPRWHWWKISR